MFTGIAIIGIFITAQVSAYSNIKFSTRLCMLLENQLPTCYRGRSHAFLQPHKFSTNREKHLIIVGEVPTNKIMGIINRYEGRVQLQPCIWYVY